MRFITEVAALIQIFKYFTTYIQLFSTMAGNSDPKKAASIYEFSAKDIDGNEVRIIDMEILNLFNL